MMASKKRSNQGVYNESTSDNYNTFDNIIKQRIITEIKQKLLAKRVIHQNEVGIRSEDLVKKLETKQNKNIYNQILKEILPRYISSFDTSTRNLREWRRRLKGWMESFEKEELRGSPLIPLDKLEAFKDAVIKVLPDLASKDIEQLRIHICNIANQMKIEVKDPKKSFSRNWWYLFLKKHTEIRAIWDQVPLGGTPKELSENEKRDSEKFQDFSASKLESSSNDGIGEDQLPMEIEQLDAQNRSFGSSPKEFMEMKNNAVKIENNGFEEIDQFFSYNANDEASESLQELYSEENRDRVYLTRDHSLLSKGLEKKTSLESVSQAPKSQNQEKTQFTDFFNFFGLYQQDSKIHSFFPNFEEDKTDQI